MALTKITGQVVDTTTDLVVGVTTVGGGVSAVDGFFSGIVTFSQGVSIGGTLTYEDVTNIDSVGIITARSNILVGSGITLSPDGHVFTTGISTFGGDIKTSGSNIILGDSSGSNDDRIKFGADGDLEIYHDASHSRIVDGGTGGLKIQSNALAIDNAAGTETMAAFTEDGSVQLRHNNSTKLETASGGVTVTGTVAATSYTGDGSALTGIQAGIQTSVPKSISGITTVLDLSKDDMKITAAGITTVDVRGGSEGNSHTLRIVNSGITTVGFSTYFLFPSGATPNLPTTDGAISLISFTVHRQGAVGLATQLLAGSSVNFS